jgi:Flp pilus assembly pilin Flp
MEESEMLKLAKSLWHDESGLSVVEYGIGAAVLAAIILGLMKVLKGKLGSLFNSVPDGNAVQGFGG